MPRRRAPSPAHRPWYTILYIQVLIAIALGILLGHFFPKIAIPMKPLGDGFIALIKMMIAPMIFCTVVHGISSMSDLKKIGRIGLKTLIYFEVVSTLALAIGIIVGEVLQPGAGFNIDPATLDPKLVAGYAARAKEDSLIGHLLAIIPQDSYFGALARGDLLQILLISILTGFAVSQMGPLGEKISAAIDTAAKMFFGIIRIIVRVAPIGAFGAMAFTIGQYGIGSLANLGALIATFYITSLLFVFLVLGTIARFSGFSILRFLGYIKDELLIVLGTSSSETVLPNLMRKMEHLGASKPVVGLVVPTGYSFNLDGTNIYMTLSILFLAQATNTPLTYRPVPRDPGHRHDHLEGRLGRHRRRLRHPGGDARDHSRRADPVDRDPARHRQVHERMPRADEPRRQRRRLHRHQPLRERARRRQAPRDDGAPDLDRRGDGEDPGVRGSSLAERFHCHRPADRAIQ